MHKLHVQSRHVLLAAVPLQHMEERPVLNLQAKTKIIMLPILI